MNISGILVQTTAHHLDELVDLFKKSKDAEYHLHDDKGRIVLTIEGENAEDELNKLRRIQQLDHVIAADMVYSYSEDELDKLRDGLQNEAKIPDWLNDPNAKAKDITYNGDLKKKY